MIAIIDIRRGKPAQRGAGVWPVGAAAITGDPAVIAAADGAAARRGGFGDAMDAPQIGPIPPRAAVPAGLSGNSPGASAPV